MKYYILLFLTFLFPIFVWGQFNPNNPGDPSIWGPNASFKYEVYKNGVVFTNESDRASRYKWDFGDGESSTEKHPEHFYAVPGCYNVSLTAFNGLDNSSSLRQAYVDITPESEYTISGNFTLDPSRKGIRNFQSLDDMFKDLMELPLSDDVTITVAEGLNLSLHDLNMSEVANELIQKLKESPYKVRLDQKSGDATYLHLWNEFNKENYGRLEQLAKSLDFDLNVILGESRFSMGSKDWLFEPKGVCYGRQNDEIWFESYSRAFTYQWELAEIPEGITGYQNTGTGNIPAMDVNNLTEVYKSLVYNVSFIYQGEVYATEQVTFWVYPQTMYLNLLEPSDNGLVGNPDEVNLSWEAIPGNGNSYRVYIRCQQGGYEFEWKESTTDNKCHIDNYKNFFQYEQTYEWYVDTYHQCSGGYIRSKTRTFTIGKAADLEITEVKVEPQTAVSGKEFTVTATVTNKGSKELEAMSWKDQIRCTNASISTQYKDQTNQGLEMGQSYELSFTFIAPYEEELKALTFEINLDVDGGLLELSKSNNRKEIEIPLALLTIPEDEFKVLCNLYTQTGGDQWYLNRHWDVTTNVVDKDGWEGVTLDEDGHVLKINLSGRNLAGTLPAGLFSLPYLQTLDLSRNALTGNMDEIVPEGSTAPELVAVNLEQNQFSGAIPASINSFPKLENLNLKGNRLEAVADLLSKKINLVITGQTLPNRQIELRHKFALDLPKICLYEHDKQTKEECPLLSLQVPGYVTPMDLKYQDDAYGFVWNSYYHAINLPPNQDLVLTQTSNSAKDSKVTVQLVFGQGDANMDGYINANDIRHTLNFINDDNNSSGEGGYINFNYYAANTYQEEQAESTINVQDLVATVNILLETPQTRSGSTLRSADAESSGPAAFLSVEGGKLVIDNPAESVMDLDIILKGVTSKQIELLLPASNYLYRTRNVEGGVRFVLVCMNGPGISLGKTDIMKIKGSDASVTHAHLTNKAAKEVKSDFEGKQVATGNEAVSMPDGLSVGNIRIDRDVKALAVSVYDMSGHILSYNRVREVVPGDYKIVQWLPQGLSAGIYLVQIELHTANEIKHQIIKVLLTK